jgi:hypothetical protein
MATIAVRDVQSNIAVLGDLLRLLVDAPIGGPDSRSDDER